MTAVPLDIDLTTGGDIVRVLLADVELTPNAVRMMRGAIAQVAGLELSHAAIDAWERRLWDAEQGQGSGDPRRMVVCLPCSETAIPFLDQHEADTWAAAHRAGTGHRIIVLHGWPREDIAVARARTMAGSAA